VSLTDDAEKRGTLRNGPVNAQTSWTGGRRPTGTTFDGPAAQIYVTLGWGVSAKGNNAVPSLRNLATTWNGYQDTAWDGIVDSWIANREGGRTDWAHRMWIRLGQELGPWFPDFPGVDANLVGAIGTTTAYSATINAAMNQVNIDGDRFPIFKGAWDHVVGRIRARCAAANVDAPVFMINMVDGAADPGSGGGGPNAQWVPEVCTDVDETPDVIGLDIYGRGGNVRPTLIAGRQANGDPDNYTWTGLEDILELHRDLCLQVNRPASFPEWWSCRPRVVGGGGNGWTDSERAAFTRYMYNWINTGCGGAGVPIHSHSPFIQSDNVAGTQSGDIQIRQNWSYTYWPANDTLSAPHPAGTATSPAPLMRAALYDLFDPDEVVPI
jgi:hypothetical protein